MQQGESHNGANTDRSTPSFDHKKSVLLLTLCAESKKCICRIQRREKLSDDVDPDNSHLITAHHDPRVQFPYVTYEEAQQFSNGAMLGEEYRNLPAVENGTVSGPTELYSSPGSNLNPEIAVRMTQLPVSDPNSCAMSKHSPFSPSDPQSSCCTPPTAQGQQTGNLQVQPLTVSPAMAPAMPSRPHYADNNYVHGPIDQQSMNGDPTGIPIDMMGASIEPDFSGQTINYHFANNDPLDFSTSSLAANAPNHFNLGPNGYATHSGYHNSQRLTQQATDGHVGSAAHTAEANHIIDGALHRADPKCDCGPGCQCVYCSIHPYNEPTRERVRELASIIATDSDSSPESRPQSQYGEPFMDLSGMYPVMQQGLHPQNGVLAANSNVQETLSQPTSQSDIFLGSMNKLPTSPTVSTSNDDSDNSFQTMEFSVRPWCHDQSGTCMCGDECDCLGCVTHSGHNGIGGTHSQPGFTKVEV